MGYGKPEYNREYARDPGSGPIVVYDNRSGGGFYWVAVKELERKYYTEKPY